MSVLYVYVTGPDGSGKTQFLKSLAGGDGFVSDEEQGIEYYQVSVDETLTVSIFCSIDATRFDQLLQIPQRNLLGYIIMIDSADFDTWSLARIMMANCRGYALMPTVIAANKQDMPQAYTPEQVGGWIGMDNMVRVWGCSVVNPTSARELFLQLLYSIKMEIDRLDKLIEQIEQLAEQGSQDLGDFLVE